MYAVPRPRCASALVGSFAIAAPKFLIAFGASPALRASLPVFTSATAFFLFTSGSSGALVGVGVAGFAVTTAVDPDILIIDEVLAVGDAAFKQKCLKRIDELIAVDTTVVIVSHSMPELERICTRAVLLDKGEVVADGPFSEVAQRYQKMFGAA